MRKLNYSCPQIEIIELNSTDVLYTSNGGGIDIPEVDEFSIFVDY